MSDFIYSSLQQPAGILKSALNNIHLQNKPLCKEFHGEWGSIATIENHYPGFEPFQDTNFILFITGGPVLNFNYTGYNNGLQKDYKSRAILDKWKYKKTIKWEDDLSGPFAIICIDKINKRVELVTDLLLFIPVYHSTIKNSNEHNHIFGTHSDAVAIAAQRDADIDFVSACDLLLNTAIVFPYTFYKDVQLIYPSSIYRFDINDPDNLSANTYWLPVENYIYKDIHDAADYLRKNFVSTVEKITNGLDEVALFLSGGEDSRVVLSSIPAHIKKKAFIFLDSFNLEGIIAHKAAKSYGAELTIGYRNSSHYLNNLEVNNSLLGSQFNFTQLHTYGFHKTYNLSKYPVVFDGILSDTFLKGYAIKSVQNFKLRKHTLYTTLKTTSENNNYDNKFCNSFLFKDIYVEQVKLRRKAHHDIVSNFRFLSIKEWLTLWPISNLEGQAGLHGNHRLFRSYEPFTNSALIKLSASIPQDWKINRKLFHLAFKQLLRRSWYITHGENAHYPYFGAYTNIPLKVLEATKRKLSHYNHKNMNQGPWSKWNEVINTDTMKNKVKMYSQGFSCIKTIFSEETHKNLFENNILNSKQQLILLQLLYKSSSIEKYIIQKKELV